MLRDPGAETESGSREIRKPDPDQGKNTRSGSESLVGTVNFEGTWNQGGIELESIPPCMECS